MNDASSAWVNTAFTLIYAVVGVPLGRLSDTWKRTRVIAIGVTFWSVLTATSGLAIGYWTYLFTRMGVGIGEASCAPAGQALIGDLYPARAPRARDGHLHDGSAARPVRLLPSERRHRRGVGLARRVLRRLRARTDSRRARVADPRACARGVGRRRAGRAARNERIRGRGRRDPPRPDDVVDHPLGNPVQLPRLRGEHVPERVPAALPRDRTRRREQAVGRLARVGRRDRIARRWRARRSPAHEDAERPAGARRDRDAARRALHLHRAGTAEGQRRCVHVPDGEHRARARSCTTRPSTARSRMSFRRTCAPRQSRCTSLRSTCWARASARPSWAR